MYLMHSKCMFQVGFLILLLGKPMYWACGKPSDVDKYVIVMGTTTMKLSFEHGFNFGRHFPNKQ